MRRRAAGRLRGALVAALLLPAAHGAAQSAAERGSSAPEHCWCTESGSVANASSAQGSVPAGRLAEAWSYTAAGRLEGAPRVWHEHVLVVDRDGERRRLQLLDLASGRRLDAATFPTPRPLRPCVWNGAVALRSGLQRVEVWEFDGGRLRKRWSRDASGEVSGPLLLGRDLYLREGGSIVRRDARTGEVRWRCEGDFHGEPALRGDSLYAVEYRDADGLLAMIAAADGRRISRTRVGGHAQGAPPRHEPIRIQVLDHHVLVRHVRAVRSSDGTQSNTTLLDRASVGGRPQLSVRTLLNVVDDVVPWEGGWIGEALLRGRDPVLVFDPGQAADYEVLASVETGPRLVRPGVAPSRVGEAMWTGARLVDLQSRELLRSLPEDPVSRPVPVRDGVLVARSDRVLVLQRCPPAGARALPRLVAQRLAATTPAQPVVGRGVLASGVCLEGRFVLSRTGAATSWRLRIETADSPVQERAAGDVLWLEDAQGAALWAGPGSAALVGLHALVDQRQAKGFTLLATQAVEAGDLDAAARLVDAAQHRDGGPGTEVAEARLAQARRGPRPTIDAKKQALVRAREASLVELPAAMVMDRVRRLPVETPVDLRLSLLREVLRLNPRHAAAAAMVRSMLPPGASPNEPFEPLDWLDFLEAALRTEVEVVVDSSPTARRHDPEVRRLLELRESWRPDLVAVRSPSLLVITPLRHPGRIARTLALGEQVCGHLDQMFSFAGVRRDGRDRLLLLLYETAEEYHRLSGMSAEDSEWTSGHYSLQEKLARLYLPADEDGFERVQGTFVHELTHHWCYERCPLLDPEQVPGVRTPGFWVVEGLPGFMENLEYDLHSGRFSPPLLSDALDVLAAAPAEVLLPWDRLFAVNQQQFAQLDRSTPHVVPLMRWLGRGRPMGDTSMFYVQSAAATHYLFFAERGRHRRALLEYVAAQMANRRDALSVPQAFGMSAQELGERVLRYAKDQRSSWR